jgi:hypothetical protein
MKTCGTCTECCKVIPVRELGTKTYGGCPHRRDVIHREGPGCGIYPTRPRACQSWKCVWLHDQTLEDDVRPDHCGFIVDETMDLIRLNGEEWPAAQIWVLPGHEDAWQQDPAQAVILGLCHSQERLAVLWRLPPGDRSRAMRLTPQGLEVSNIQHIVRDDKLPPEAIRTLRAGQLITAQQKRQRDK